jgi:rhodanese-related sulfurtransferase
MKTVDEILKYLVHNHDRIGNLMLQFGLDVRVQYVEDKEKYEQEYANATRDKKIGILSDIIENENIPGTLDFTDEQWKTIYNDSKQLEKYVKIVVYCDMFMREFGAIAYEQKQQHEQQQEQKQEQQHEQQQKQKQPIVKRGFIPWWVYFIAAILFIIAVITIIVGIIWIIVGVIAYMKLPRSVNILARILLGPFNFV